MRWTTRRSDRARKVKRAGRIVRASRARVQMRLRVGDAHQESDDDGLHVAEMKVPVTFAEGTLVIIAVH